MPVWGRGVLTLPVSKKCKNEKEKKRKKEEKEEERDKERELHRHDVWSKLTLRFTNGGRELRTVRTHTSLFGERGPCRCLEGSGAFGEDTPSERIKPRRRGTYLSCPKRSTLISPGDSLFLFQCFGGASSSCDRNVQQTTSGLFQRRARSKFGKKVPGSCNRFQAWSCDSLRHRTGRRTRAPVRDRVFDMAAGNKWHCQLRVERVINDVVLMWTRGVGQRCSSACTHAQLEWFIFFSNFAENFHLNSWSMPF